MSLTILSVKKLNNGKQFTIIDILCVKTKTGKIMSMCMCTHIHLYTIGYALHISRRILDKPEAIVV